MKLAMHGHNYKATALNGLDKHNRRFNKEYGNLNINVARKEENILLITPVVSLYQDAKKRIEENVLVKGGRVTRASNWLTEFIIYGEPEMRREQAQKYFTLVVDYFAEKVGRENIISAVVHGDETHYHMHLDFTPITLDNRLSSKRIMTRQFLLSLHDELPKVLQAHGFHIERGESVKESERNLKGRSARQYKSEIEREKAELLKQCGTAKLVREQLLNNNLSMAEKMVERERGKSKTR